MKKILQILIIFFLAIFSNQAISQENIINKTSDTPSAPKVKPLLNNKTASPILKETNKNSNNSIKSLAPSPINPEAKNPNSDLKSSNNNQNSKSIPSQDINKNNNTTQNSQDNNKSSSSNQSSSNLSNSSSANSTSNSTNSNNTISNTAISTNTNPTNSTTPSSANKSSPTDSSIKDSSVNLDDSKKSPMVKSKKPSKNIYNKNIQNSKKNIKNPKKNIPIKNDVIISKEPENKKYINENGRKISGDYFLQINSKKSCDIITQTECFRRDRKNEEPYFHKTIVNIFNNQIVAEQYFTTTNNNKKIFLKVNNGNYQLTTTNDNLISFTVENGIVKDLTLVSGNISRENLIVSKCVIAEKNYGYLMAYNKQPKLIETNYFTNKNNFEGVRNIAIFTNIENINNLTPQDLMAIEIKSYNNIYAVENLNLCKKPNSDILEVREISKAECNKRQECLILINSNPDFQNKIIDESCLGYFDSKRQDFQSCSASPECNDYLIIKDCEVKLIAEE